MILVLAFAVEPATADPIDTFVTRFYQDVLARAPDAPGLAGWNSFLQANCNAAGFDGLARGFFGSPEFVQTNRLTIAELVTRFYRTFLGREPDPGGLAGWASVIREARLAMALNGFVPSPEFQTLLPDRTDRAAVTTLVTRLYQQILERSPDPPGLNGWVDNVVQTGDLGALARGFLASPEFEGRPLTFPEFVTILYRTFLGREPDPAGLEGWVAVLRDAMLQVINAGFVPSVEFQGIRTVLCSPPAAVSVASLSRTSGAPGDRVAVAGSGFQPSADLFLRFFDDRGYDVEVRAVSPTATTFTVGVPPYFNLQTGEFGASPGTLSVQVVQRTGVGTSRSNTIEGFRIDALPTTGVAAGVVTLDWLSRMIQESEEAIRRLDAQSQLFPASTSHATLRTTLSAQLTTLKDMRTEISGLMAGQTSSIPFGQIGGTAVQLDSAALALIDRLFAAQGAAVRNAASSLTTTGDAFSMPFQTDPLVKPGAFLVPPAFDSAFSVEALTFEEDFAQFFANIREQIRRNRETMARVGGAAIAVGGLIAAGGAATPGLAIAGLGALTWYVGVHAHTGILLALDVGTAETLGGRTAYENARQDMLSYLGEVFSQGASYVAGTLNQTVGRLLDLRTVGTDAVNLTRRFIDTTQEDFDAGRIPADGATTLTTDQSCCVIHGGCPGETGTQCAPNCCCCPLGQACDLTNTRNGCVPRP